MDFPSSVLYGTHSTLKRGWGGGGGAANRNLSVYLKTYDKGCP